MRGAMVQDSVPRDAGRHAAVWQDLDRTWIGRLASWAGAPPLAERVAANGDAVGRAGLNAMGRQSMTPILTTNAEREAHTGRAWPSST